MQSWKDPMQMMWTALQAIKGGGKGKGGKGPCHRCGQYGHLIKDCPVWPASSEIDWACIVEDEPQELNAAEEEKQSREDDFEVRGLSERAKKRVEERKKRLSSNSAEKRSPW